MPTIYCKTPEGQHEIETRARRIAPRARAALILVDGKRSNEDLAKLVEQSEETLGALLEAGLIAAVARLAPKPRGPAAGSGPGAPATSTADLGTLRRDAARAVNELLGPQGDPIAVKIERAADEAQLRAALERALASIATARGGAVAATFAGRFLRDTPA